MSKPLLQGERFEEESCMPNLAKQKQISYRTASYFPETNLTAQI
jgi:hypothetical protein